MVFADGRTVWGQGFGAEGEAVGELCFNTAMTGYQEVMTDPSYAKQVIAFTFPHIGNVGANDEDVEAGEAHALGCLVREVVTEPSNYRANQGFADWMREMGPDRDRRRRHARADQAGAERGAADDCDRASRGRASSTSRRCRRWRRTGRGSRAWTSPRTSAGCRSSAGPAANGPGGRAMSSAATTRSRPHVVAVDYGTKRNIFRNLVEAGARVTVVPATASFDEIMAHEPDGFFLSNGPGDPAATGEYAVPVIQADAGDEEAAVRHLPRPPDARARGRRQDVEDVPGPPRRQPSGQAARRRAGRDHQHEPRLRGRARGLPDNVRETHVSLFDGSNCGIELTDRPAFSVQYHPEASPGPQDSFYLFEKFVGSDEVRRALAALRSFAALSRSLADARHAADAGA